MRFAGNLGTLSLVEVFQTLNRIQATGVLRLVSADGGRDVIFDQGEILGVGFRSGEEGQALLRRLITEGVITPEDAANISSDGRSAAIVASLVEAGIATAADVDDARQRQALDELHNLLTWDYADFVFHDAGPDAPEYTASVNEHRTHPLGVSLNSLLMESARRSDEWNRYRQTITDDDMVLGPSQGAEDALSAAAGQYPGSAVVPLVDGVRTVGDIVKASVATRFDVYAVLVELLAAQHIVLLTRDDLIYHGDYLRERDDPARAAMVYRRALAEDPSDVETTKKLAACLENLGDNPTAAGCHGQLALAMLAEGQTEQACDHARRAVALAPQDPQLRLSLVRCLLGEQDSAGAIAELKKLAGQYLDGGQLEDARGTCLKIIEIDPKDEDARRELARIYSQAENDPGSEDVVVCVSCSHVNHREAASCAKCDAALHLTCINCGRVVGVSDRICIFCGANPNIVKGKHAGFRRMPGGNPTTSRVVGRPDDLDPGIAAAVAARARTPTGGRAADAAPATGTSTRTGTASLRKFKNQLEEFMAKAAAAEQENRWQDALGFWKEVAKIQPESPELQERIRELEGRIHDEHIEAEIERGHRLKKLRRFWGAGKAYKNALRLMGTDDPRADRLIEIVRATGRQQQKIAVLYAAGILLVAAGAWVAAWPWIQLGKLKRDAAEVADRIERSARQPGLLNQQQDDVEALLRRARAIPSSVRGQAVTLATSIDAQWRQTRFTQLESAFRDLAEAVEQRDPGVAEQRAEEIREHFPAQANSPRLATLLAQIAALKEERQSIDRQLKEAPERLRQAQAAEAAKRLLEATALYRGLTGSRHAEVAGKAKEAVARLEADEKAFLESWAKIGEIEAADLTKAGPAMASMEAAAAAWGREPELAARRAAAAQRLAAAEEAYRSLGESPTAASIEAFMAAHPATPQIGLARTRLEVVRRQEAARAAAVESWRGLIQERNYERAYQLGRELIAAQGRAAIEAGIRLPLLVDSIPGGARISLAGRELGTAPVVVPRLPGATGDLRIELPGHVPATRPIAELESQWRWSATLVRAPLWRIELGVACQRIQHLPDGRVLAVTPDSVLQLDAEGGSVRWRTGLAGDELALGARPGSAHVPTPLADGRLLIGAPGRDAVLLTAGGQIATRWKTRAEVRGRPLVYSNDMFSTGPRVAWAAEEISAGDPDGQPATSIPLPSPAAAGPLAVPIGADQMLIVATVAGGLVAVEESSRKILWSTDLRATEVGGMQAIGRDGALLGVDGNRLIRYQLSPAGASVRWSQTLADAMIGEPVIAGDAVICAVGRQVVRIGIEGGMLPSINLPSPTAVAPAAAGDLLVVACRDQSLHVFRGGAAAWTTALPAQAAAVGIAGRRIIVSLADGSIIAYAP